MCPEYLIPSFNLWSHYFLFHFHSLLFHHLFIHLPFQKVIIKFLPLLVFFLFQLQNILWSLKCFLKVWVFLLFHCHIFHLLWKDNVLHVSLKDRVLLFRGIFYFTIKSLLFYIKFVIWIIIIDCLWIVKNRFLRSH